MVNHSASPPYELPLPMWLKLSLAYSECSYILTYQVEIKAMVVLGDSIVHFMLVPFHGVFTCKEFLS